GFIGLGDMGKPMAKNLVGDAFEAWVHDVSPAPVAELVALGAKAATSPAELAAACELIGLCVRDDRDVESLLHGEGGLLANARPGTVIAVHSTVTQAGLLRWAGEAAARGIHLIDAPVTRGRLGQPPRFICYLVGGPAEVLERCRPVFETSAEAIIHAGPLGAGAALKLCNNLITNLEFAAMSEAMAIAGRAGLSLDVLAEVGRGNGVINERMLAFIGGRAKLAGQAAGSAAHGFFDAMGRLAEKDLDAAIDSARALGVPVPVTACTRDRIRDIYLDRNTEA
ncbi:MAG: NAD(P)-dependent oxidoreductase, partial [Gammaproteobacteria bacterium]